MPVIAVVGMAGSGKTTEIAKYVAEGWHPVDNIYKHLPKRLEIAQQLVQSGVNVIVSDVQLCRQDKRDGLAQELGIEAIDQWVYFANDPQQCAMNCLYRWMHKKHDDLRSQIKDIQALTRVYVPPIEARPIWKCPEVGEWPLRRPTH